MSEQQNNEEELLTVKEACNYVTEALNCSSSSFYRYYRRQLICQSYGQNPAGKPGNWKCRKSQVEEIIQNALSNPGQTRATG